MKMVLIILLAAVLPVVTWAQKSIIQEKIDEGIRLYDQHRYKEAAEEFKKAILVDSLSEVARYELSMAYFALGEYEKAIELSRWLVKYCQEDGILRNMYVIHGSCLDNLERPEEAIEVYKQGLARYPDFFLLQFNLGVTRNNIRDYLGAEECFKRAIVLNQRHPGSHYALAQVMAAQEKRAPSILAALRFLSLEPKGERASRALEHCQQMFKQGIEREAADKIQITIKPKDTATAYQDDDFTVVDMVVSMASALDMGQDKGDKSDAERFLKQVQSFCSVLEEQKPKNRGFFWDRLAPYFIEMKKRGYLEEFIHYLFFCHRDEQYLDQWVEKNKKSISEFLIWSEAYRWKE